jgi:hypothetical protein
MAKPNQNGLIKEAQRPRNKVALHSRIFKGLAVSSFSLMATRPPPCFSPKLEGYPLRKLEVKNNEKSLGKQTIHTHFL